MLFGLYTQNTHMFLYANMQRDQVWWHSIKPELLTPWWQAYSELSLKFAKYGFSGPQALQPQRGQKGLRSPQTVADTAEDGGDQKKDLKEHIQDVLLAKKKTPDDVGALTISPSDNQPRGKYEEI